MTTTRTPLRFEPIVGKCGICGKEIDSRKADCLGCFKVWVIGSEFACSQTHADQLQARGQGA